jgi:hypothetical protein
MQLNEMKQKVNKEIHLELCHCGPRRTRACNSLKQEDKENDCMRMGPRMRKKLHLTSEKFNIVLWIVGSTLPVILRKNSAV